MIRLAPLEWEHWREYRTWVNDAEIAHLTDRYLPVSEFQHKEFYAKMQSDRSKIFFSILGSKDSFIGVCALKNIDAKNRKAEFYICLNGEKNRGKGYGVIATKACLDYAFNTLNLNRVYLYTPEYNKKAIDCYQKVGFKQEGRSIQSIYSQGNYFDSIHMYYLKSFAKRK